MDESILKTWQLHARSMLDLLDHVAPEALGSVSASGGRSVAAQFAHLHNVRCTWLEVCAPDLMAGRHKIPMKTKADKAGLTPAVLRGVETGKTRILRPAWCPFWAP